MSAPIRDPQRADVPAAAIVAVITFAIVAAFVVSGGLEFLRSTRKTTAPSSAAALPRQSPPPTSASQAAAAPVVAVAGAPVRVTWRLKKPQTDTEPGRVEVGHADIAFVDNGCAGNFTVTRMAWSGEIIWMTNRALAVTIRKNVSGRVRAPVLFITEDDFDVKKMDPYGSIDLDRWAQKGYQIRATFESTTQLPKFWRLIELRCEN